MAGRIQGITVEIGGDVTGLNKALDGVDKSIRSTQAELRDVNRLLKLDPTNTELLQQKHKLLAQAIGETKDRLGTLKTAERQAQEQFSQGKISEEQYKALKREIEATEQSLKGLEKQARDAHNTISATLDQAGKKLQDVGGKVEAAGKKFMPLSTAAVAAGAASTKVFSDFDDAMRQVQATMGGTEGDLGKLTEAAKKYGAETRFTATDSANALNYLALAGYDTEKAIETLPKVLQLAAAGNLDLAYASDLVTDSMAALGMESSELDSYIDRMAKTSQKSNTNIAQLGEATLVVAGQATLANMSVTDMNTALGILADNGIKGSEGGTALRNVLKNLYTPTNSAAAAMRELGVDTADADGNLKDAQSILKDLGKALDGLTESDRIKAMGNIFDTRTIAGANALMKDSGERWTELSSLIDDADGTAQSMADTLESGIGGAFREMKSAIEALAISLGGTLSPMIQRVAGFIRDLALRFSGLDESQKQTIITIGLVVAAIGPLLVIGGKIISGLGSLIQLMGFLAANPIVAVIAAIAALVGALVHLWNTNEEFREIVMDIWEGIKKFFASVGEWLKKFFTEDIPEFIQSCIEWFQNLPYNIGLLMGQAIGHIAKFGIDAFNWVVTKVPEIIGKIVEFFATLPGRIWEWLLNTIGKLKEWALSVIEWAKTELPGVIQNIVDFFMELPGKLWDVGVEMIKGLWEGIKSMAAWIGDKISDFVGGIVDGVKGVLGIQSPSRVFAGIGEFMAMGLGEGFSKEMKSVAQMIDKAVPTSQILVGATPSALQSGSTPAAGRQIVIHMENHFGERYQSADGAAAVRDLNRQLGSLY